MAHRVGVQEIENSSSSPDTVAVLCQERTPVCEVCIMALHTHVTFNWDWCVNSIQWIECMNGWEMGIGHTFE